MNEDLKVIDEQGDPPADTPAAETPASASACDDVKAERDKFYDLLLRKTAEFGNYGGGPARKKAMLAWESGLAESQAGGSH